MAHPLTYRDHAAQAHADAEAATLDNVRDRCLRAEAAWLAMAERHDDSHRTARYQGFGKDGKGQLDSPRACSTHTPYSYNTRFGDEKGTNPEELIAAAHAGCFTMALSFALAKAGFSEGSLETTAAVKLEQQGDGFAITHSDLTLKAERARHLARAVRRARRRGQGQLPGLEAAQRRDHAEPYAGLRFVTRASAEAGARAARSARAHH
jgi:OsmC subfamily peroxiredoxin